MDDDRERAQRLRFQRGPEIEFPGKGNVHVFPQGQERRAGFPIGFDQVDSVDVPGPRESLQGKLDESAYVLENHQGIGSVNLGFRLEGIGLQERGEPRFGLIDGRSVPEPDRLEDN